MLLLSNWIATTILALESLIKSLYFKYRCCHGMMTGLVILSDAVATEILAWCDNNNPATWRYTGHPHTIFSSVSVLESYFLTSGRFTENVTKNGSG